MGGLIFSVAVLIIPMLVMVFKGRSDKISCRCFTYFLISIFIAMSLLSTGCADIDLFVNHEEPDSLEKIASSSGDNNQENLEVHFIDVGQGDAIYVKLPSGENLVIDGGKKAAGDKVVKYLKGQGVEDISYVIGTHPHEDHIGGLIDVIKDFNIGKIMMPKVSHTTETYKNLLLAIKDKGIKITAAHEGLELDVGRDVNAVLVAPNSVKYKKLNDYSVVLKLTYGDTTFLFTGDAEKISEGEITKKGIGVRAQVLKVGHHGSITSTTTSFLEAVLPEYAVISAGENNDYGHPHQEIIERLQGEGVHIVRTDLNGTIVFISDGNSVHIR